MTWNYRIVRKQDPDYPEEFYFEIHEAHYNEAGKLCFISEDPISPIGNDIKELKETLKQMRQSCKSPILIDGKIEFASWDDEDEIND